MRLPSLSTRTHARRQADRIDSLLTTLLLSKIPRPCEPREEDRRQKTVALTNVDLPYQLGFRREWPTFFAGGFFVLGWYVGLPILSAEYFRRRHKDFFEKMGMVRFIITANLFWIMMSLPMKVLLRLAFNTKYIWTTKYINF